MTASASSHSIGAAPSGDGLGAVPRRAWPWRCRARRPPRPGRPGPRPAWSSGRCRSRRRARTRPAGRGRPANRASDTGVSWRSMASAALTQRSARESVHESAGGAPGRSRSATSSTRATTSWAQAMNASTSPPPGSTTSSHGAELGRGQVQLGDALGQRSAVGGQLAGQPLERDGAVGGRRVLAAHPVDVLGRQPDHDGGPVEVLGDGLAAAVRRRLDADGLEAGAGAPAHRQAVDRHRAGGDDLDVGEVGAEHGPGDHRAGRVAGAEDEDVGGHGCTMSLTGVVAACVAGERHDAIAAPVHRCERPSASEGAVSGCAGC